MNKHLFALLICFLFPTLLLAELWQHQTTVQAQRSGGGTETSTFKLWLPANVSVAKAFVIISDRSAECKKFSEHEMLRQSAAANGYGIIYCTGANTYAVSFNTTLHHHDSLQHALAKLAVLSSHPEVEHAPLISFGHSMGINFSTGMGYWNHQRMAGIISFKLGSLPTPSWATQLQTDSFATIPHLAVSGELEGPDFNNGGTSYLTPQLRTSVLGRRAKSELIHQIVERNGSHTSLPDWLVEYMVMFIEKTISYRVPTATNALTATVELNKIAESSGYLGNSSAYNNFKASNYTVSAFQAGNPAGDFWFFDNDLANYWKQWHTAELLFTIATAPPYCNGDTVTVNYTTGAGVTFQEGNVFKMLLSNVHGAFNYYTYALRSVGAHASTATSGSFQIIIPDNIHEYSTAVNTNIQSRTEQNRYRLKLVSTHPYYEGENNGADFSITACNASSLMVAPLKKIDTYPVSVFKKNSDTTFSVFVARSTDVTLNAGNTISIQLSNSMGSFANPTVIGTKATQITTLSGVIGTKTYYRDEISVTIPDTLAEGHHYRMRIVSSDPQIVGSTAGEFYTVADTNKLVTNVAFYEEPGKKSHQAPTVYPNPFVQRIHIRGLSETVHYELMSFNGLMLASGTWKQDNEVLETSELPSGLYFLKIKDSQGMSIKKLVKAP